MGASHLFVMMCCGLLSAEQELTSDAIVKEGKWLAPLVTADHALGDVQTVPH